MASHTKEYMAEWRSKNRERCRDYQRKYRKNNLAKVRASNRSYEIRNPHKKKEWIENNPDRISRIRKRCYLKNKSKWVAWSLKSNYGITPAQFTQMWEEQNGVCAICCNGNNHRGLQVDHDHSTGKVRALLCNSCNTALGLAKDDIGRLMEMIHYLERHSS